MLSEYDDENPYVEYTIQVDTALGQGTDSLLLLDGSHLLLIGGGKLELEQQ